VPNMPPLDLVPGVRKMPRNGSIFIGEKGRIFLPGVYGGSQKFLPEGDFKDVNPPTPYLPRGTEHHAEWIQACKGNGKALSSFEYGGRLTEIALLGVVAYRTGRKIEWDATAFKARNGQEGDQFIKPEYRRGWTL
jgi:hypothetical protein